MITNLEYLLFQVERYSLYSQFKNKNLIFTISVSQKSTLKSELCVTFYIMLIFLAPKFLWRKNCTFLIRWGVSPSSMINSLLQSAIRLIYFWEETFMILLLLREEAVITLPNNPGHQLMRSMHISCELNYKLNLPHSVYLH